MQCGATGVPSVEECHGVSGIPAVSLRMLGWESTEWEYIWEQECRVGGFCHHLDGSSNQGGSREVEYHTYFEGRIDKVY